MEKHTQAIYVREIRHQAELGLISANSITVTYNHLHSRQLREDGFGSVVAVFRELHSLLTHASNISKLFWPVVGDQPKKPEKLAVWNRKVQRGEFLRALYGMADDNALASRELRNHLEHFDERLDDFSVELNDAGLFGYVDVAITDSPNSIQGHQERFMLRQYRTDTGDFIFRGEPYNMVAIAEAVHGVWLKSKEMTGY